MSDNEKWFALGFAGASCLCLFVGIMCTDIRRDEAQNYFQLHVCYDINKTTLKDSKP